MQPRDGRSFSTRHILAIQDGKPMFDMSVSFHTEEESLIRHIPQR